jgi:hypothetical protein
MGWAGEGAGWGYPAASVQVAQSAALLFFGWVYFAFSVIGYQDMEWPFLKQLFHDPPRWRHNTTTRFHRSGLSRLLIVHAGIPPGTARM